MIGGQLRGCATTDIDGLNTPPLFGGGWGEASQFHFLTYGIHVWLYQLMASGRVEAAIDTPACTEGNMDIKSCHGVVCEKQLQKYEKTFKKPSGKQ